MGFMWLHFESFLHSVASPFHSFVTNKSDTTSLRQAVSALAVHWIHAWSLLSGHGFPAYGHARSAFQRSTLAIDGPCIPLLLHSSVGCQAGNALRGEVRQNRVLPGAYTACTPYEDRNCNMPYIAPYTRVWCRVVAGKPQIPG